MSNDEIGRDDVMGDHPLDHRPVSSGYRVGDRVVFVAQRPATIRGVRFLVGYEYEVILTRDWDGERGMGEGGPWGWGGFTSKFVASLGR